MKDILAEIVDILNQYDQFYKWRYAGSKITGYNPKVKFQQIIDKMCEAEKYTNSFAHFGRK